MKPGKIGQELAAKMRASGSPEQAAKDWSARVVAEMEKTGNRFTPENAVLFCEMVPFAVDEERFTLPLTHSEIVLWEEPIFVAASKGHECLVGDAPPPLTYTAPQIWLRSYPWETPEGEQVFGTVIMPVVSTYHNPKKPGRAIQAFDMRGTKESGLSVVSTESIIAEDFPVEAGDSALLAMYLFLQQEWVEARAHVFPRPFRRKYEREKKPIPEVKVVVLRRSTAASGEVSEQEGEIVTREYSCQWIVSGHWRRQYYPSTGEHAPKYIAPYPKGPADKPLRAARPTVYVAKR